MDPHASIQGYFLPNPLARSGHQGGIAVWKHAHHDTKAKASRKRGRTAAQAAGVARRAGPCTSGTTCPRDHVRPSSGVARCRRVPREQAARTDAPAPEFSARVAGVDRSPANPGGEADARSLAGLRRARRGDGAHMGRAISPVVRYELSRPPKRNGLRRGDGARGSSARSS
jgi:hypothetical protein